MRPGTPGRSLPCCPSKNVSATGTVPPSARAEGEPDGGGKRVPGDAGIQNPEPTGSTIGDSPNEPSLRDPGQRHWLKGLNAPPPLADFSEYLATRREAILEAWRAASEADRLQPTAHSLSQSQFNDHIPELLDALERKLRSRPGGHNSLSAGEDMRVEEGKHGLQRWQQGYRQEELMREWGLLHLCLVRELEQFALQCPDWAPADQWSANRELLLLINEGVAKSAAHYAAHERAEAAGRARNLELTLAQVRGLELRRSQLIRQVVHDLRGNVQSVSNVADLLGCTGIPEADRVGFATQLQNNVEGVTAMLGDLVELARLEAGQEVRTIASFDVSPVLTCLCEVNRSRADTRQLDLIVTGPPQLLVEGDANKVRRIMQNLLLNALKYTETGSVTVSWGREDENWWMMVKDTGPGLPDGPGAPLVAELRAATVTARETDVKAADAQGRVSHVLNQADAGSTRPGPGRQQRGEGIGLSIVKRLCELLDASLELISSGESGTTLRVVFPLTYPPGTMRPPSASEPASRG